MATKVLDFIDRMDLTKPLTMALLASLFGFHSRSFAIDLGASVDTQRRHDEGLE